MQPNVSTKQLRFPWAPATLPVSKIQQKFAKFHAANPLVYATLVRLAREARALGMRRIGIKMLWERLRWECMVPVKDGWSNYRLSNDYPARYARLIMETEPDLKGVFDTRELRA